MSTDNNRGSRDTNFTSLTFDEIKKRLINRAKTYYPDSYKDFNKTSFGSLMFDIVSLASEQLGFYAQFVANEAFIETSRQYTTQQLHGRKAGKKINNSYTSTGMVKMYTIVPADPVLANPDQNYKHRVLKGAILTTPAGATFTTTRDIVVDLSTDNIVGTTFSEDASRVTYYIFESEVPVVSGEDRKMSVSVGSYRKFLKLEVRDSTVSEILKIVDSNGNEYYEVDNLSQNVIHVPISDRTTSDTSAPSKLVPLPVPRRFTIEHEGERTFPVFGFGSEDNLKVKNVADPSEIALQRTAKSYVSDVAFDPSNLLATDKFGVSPQNTTLNITYRSNTSENSNAPVGSIVRVSNAEIIFDDETTLDASKVSFIKENITCRNDEPINGALTYSTTQEVSQVIKSSLGTQGRAVTLKDYEAAAYIMPPKFGSVKRVSVNRDSNDLKRNLNMFVISQDSEGNLQTASTSLKNNLKTWLNSVRMVSDTIDIFDAKIINLGIHFDVTLSKSSNFSTALSEIRRDLHTELSLSKSEIGQSFSVGEVERILNSMPVVSRVNSVKINSKSGTGYSDVRFDVLSNVSPNGGLIYIPENSIWEVKKASDITGKIQ